jgi:N-acetylmuramoyl-L-alanine amidase
MFVFACVKLITVVISNIDIAVSSSGSQGSKNILIAIDSGHDSQTDKGAVASGGVFEYKLNDGVSEYLEQELTSRGYKVIQTRRLDSNDEKTLNERALTVNEAWPDLLVSIHHNANEDTTVNGFSIIYDSKKTDIYDGEYIKYKNAIYKVTKQEGDYIYYQSGSREKKLNAAKNEGKYQLINLTSSRLVKESIAAADKIYYCMKTLDFISPLSSNKDNVIIDQNLQILRQTHCAGVTVECGFMTNEAELAKLQNQENQKAIAKAIADGIDAYFNISGSEESN